LGTSDGAGIRFPGQDQPDEPVWRLGADLTPPEEEMRAAAAAGELVDRGEGPLELTEMRAWGEERTVRAAKPRQT
jgi:hypothetical protein